MFNDMPLFVREREEGIWTLESEGPTLVNSSARTFSQFIGLLETRSQFVVHIPGNLRSESVELVRKSMAQIDSRAMQSDFLWPPFIEDLALEETWFED